MGNVFRSFSDHELQSKRPGGHSGADLSGETLVASPDLGRGGDPQAPFRSQLSGLRVVARNSTFADKNSSEDERVSTDGSSTPHPRLQQQPPQNQQGQDDQNRERPLPQHRQESQSVCGEEQQGRQWIKGDAKRSCEPRLSGTQAKDPRNRETGEQGEGEASEGQHSLEGIAQDERKGKPLMEQYRPSRGTAAVADGEAAKLGNVFSHRP